MVQEVDASASSAAKDEKPDMDEAAIRERLRVLDEWERDSEVRDRY